MREHERPEVSSPGVGPLPANKAELGKLFAYWKWMKPSPRAPAGSPGRLENAPRPAARASVSAARNQACATFPCAARLRRGRSAATVVSDIGGLPAADAQACLKARPSTSRLRAGRCWVAGSRSAPGRGGFLFERLGRTCIWMVASIGSGRPSWIGATERGLSNT